MPDNAGAGAFDGDKQASGQPPLGLPPAQQPGAKENPAMTVVNAADVKGHQVLLETGAELSDDNPRAGYTYTVRQPRAVRTPMSVLTRASRVCAAQFWLKPLIKVSGWASILQHGGAAYQVRAGGGGGGRRQ